MLDRKQRRFLMRAHTGISVGKEKGYRFRWFVLTESDEAIGQNVSFRKEWNKFRAWIKRRSPECFEFLIVEHKQGAPSIVSGLQRRNWHIISYGSDKLPIADMEAYWLAHFKSKVTGMAEIKDIDKAIYYLAGYLAQEDKFIRAWMSHGWVFPGWVQTTKAYKRTWDKYMERADVTWLATLDKPQRDIQIAWAISRDM